MHTCMYCTTPTDVQKTSNNPFISSVLYLVSDLFIKPLELCLKSKHSIKQKGDNLQKLKGLNGESLQNFVNQKSIYFSVFFTSLDMFSLPRLYGISWKHKEVHS